MALRIFFCGAGRVLGRPPPPSVCTFTTCSCLGFFPLFFVSSHPSALTLSAFIAPLIPFATPGRCRAPLGTGSPFVLPAPVPFQRRCTENPESLPQGRLGPILGSAGQSFPPPLPDLFIENNFPGSAKSYFSSLFLFPSLGLFCSFFS